MRVLEYTPNLGGRTRVKERWRCKCFFCHTEGKRIRERQGAECLMRMCLKGVERVLRFFETCEKVKKDTRSGVSVQVLVGVMRSESDPPSSYPIFSFLYFLLFDLFFFYFIPVLFLLLLRYMFCSPTFLYYYCFILDLNVMVFKFIPFYMHLLFISHLFLCISKHYPLPFILLFPILLNLVTIYFVYSILAASNIIFLRLTFSSAFYIFAVFSFSHILSLYIHPQIQAPFSLPEASGENTKQAQKNTEELVVMQSFPV